jgi:uncharacterized Ntn-hydrolase superfamily protein
MTFSLAGRCARTGMLGAVVTTSSIAVGSRCPFARARVGAALTQHRTDPRLGRLALDLLSRGYDVSAAMQAVVALAPQAEWRQLALIDAAGHTASYTGAKVDATKAAEAHGIDCVAIANIVRSTEVPGAMIRAFEADPNAPLASRLLDALAAGDAAGGEFRPIVSAALAVAHAESFPYVDLRVDEHTYPIQELRRLWLAYAPEADAYVGRANDPGSATYPALPA